MNFLNEAVGVYSMREEINANRNLVSKLGRETWMYVYYIKTDLQEIWHEVTHWLDLAHERVHWRAVGQCTLAPIHGYSLVHRYPGMTKSDRCCSNGSRCFGMYCLSQKV
jgi:hypothetical protein